VTSSIPAFNARPAAVAAGSNPGLALPLSLVPLREGSEDSNNQPRRQGTAGLGAPLVPRIGTPVQIVEACRTSIASAAVPYGAVRVDAASAGRLNATPDGGIMAPVQVRVVYARAKRSQMRQSRVACQLNAAGAVVALR
jgi:hypothetical protein